MTRRPVVLTEQESCDTLGGATLPPGPTGPIIAGGICVPPLIGVVA